MPTYKITDPTSGKTLKLTGDSPPTEQELEEIFSTINVKSEQPQVAQQPEGQATSQQGTSLLSKLTRSVMRNTPQEQYKTAGATLENIEQVPTPQEGESFFGFLSRAGQESPLAQREEEIVSGGTMSQFENQILLGLLTGFAVSPASTALGLAKFGTLEWLLNSPELVGGVGLNRAISNIQDPNQRDLAEVGKVALEGFLATRTWTPKVVKNFETKLAGNIVDSLIKPRHKEYMFGKNPGEAIAKEGIIASSMSNLKDKVQLKKSSLMDEISVIRTKAENFDKKVDASNTLQPLKDAYTKLKSMGEKSHASEITRIENALSDLTSSRKDLTKLNISEAYQLKESVSSMQSWTSDSVAGQQVNKALRKTYHSIDSAIDKAVPELESLNSRIANLISAEQAINNRIEVLRKSEPMPTVMKILDLPFAALKTTPAKTLLGSLLAKKHPKLSK